MAKSMGAGEHRQPSGDERILRNAGKKLDDASQIVFAYDLCQRASQPGANSVSAVSKRSGVSSPPEDPQRRSARIWSQEPWRAGGSAAFTTGASPATKPRRSAKGGGRSILHYGCERIQVPPFGAWVWAGATARKIKVSPAEILSLPTMTGGKAEGSNNHQDFRIFGWPTIGHEQEVEMIKE